MLYERRFVPAWAQHVDAALLRLYSQAGGEVSPNVLVAEARTGHLLEQLSLVLPERARLMAVEPTSEMLDEARRRMEEVDRRVFFSTQSMTKLSYTDGVFDLVFCGNGMLTRTDLRRAGRELVRVLKGSGDLYLALPMEGSFELFTDLFQEAILRLELRDLEQGLAGYKEALLAEAALAQELAALGVVELSREVLNFEVGFENAEDFLFSSFMERLYLPRWLAICSDTEVRERVFEDIAGAIDTYFSGPIETAVEICCLRLQQVEMVVGE